MTPSSALPLATRFWPARARPVDPRQRRVAELFHTSETRIVAQTHRVFRWLLPAQAALGVVAAVFVAPHLWTIAPAVPHLALALAAGAVLTIPPLILMHRRPDAAVTRQAVAIAQIGFSALFVHLSAGRLETHFHVFVSLAILALYRDCWMLPTATLVTFADHLLRGTWAPESLFGATGPLAWRSFEHLGWVLFEDAVLIAGCVIARREMWRVCERQDQARQELEHRVATRTRDLEAIVGEYQRTATALRESEQRHRSLIDVMPIGIFETTRSGSVLLANPYLLRLLGLPLDADLTRISMADGRIFDPAERARFWARLEADQEVLRFPARLHRVDGTVLDVVINARLKPGHGPGADLTCKGTLEDVSASRRAEQDLATLNQQLVLASRQAGMAEVATGVLHNIGNVLTSVNLIVHDAQDRLKSTRLTHLRRVVEVLQREQSRLGEFVTTDPGGRQLPEFLAKLDAHLVAENTQLLDDVGALVRHFEHIREIIVTQQSSAQLFGLAENVAPSQLFEDALRLNADSFERHGITFVRDFAAAPFVHADRHRVLQILVNLLKNSKEALKALPAGSRRIIARIAPAGTDAVALSIEDNGPGITPENLARLFQHGFTTKSGGHGFGLHSSVLAAREMGGDLTAASPGPGLGATFTLTLPRAPHPAA